MRTSPKIAIVHDWILHHRGGEKVLEALAEIFPSADIYTLFYDEKAVPGLEKRTVHASILNRLPFRQKYYRMLLPLFPWAIESLDLTGYDIILSSSHCVAKGIIPHPKALHICYCHTPMRYAWDKSSDYFSNRMRPLVSPFLHYLRIWDTTASARVDQFVANSEFVASRIRKFYRRDSIVVHPFADLNRFTPNLGAREEFYLIVSALVQYKKTEIAIEACNRLGKKLIIVGYGPEESKLRKIAGPTIHFLGKLGGKELEGYYARARALLFPGEEDFGIVPLEAMASGTPVIAFHSGGVTESVIEGETGIFFDEGSASALESAIRRFETLDKDWAPACVKQAKKFDRRSFQTNILALIGALEKGPRAQESESRPLLQ